MTLLRLRAIRRTPAPLTAIGDRRYSLLIMQRMFDVE